MRGNKAEKDKIKDIESLIVVLTCFNLFEQRFEKDIDWDDVVAHVKFHKILKHHFSDFHLPIELYHQESKCLVDDRSKRMPLLGQTV